MNVMNNETKTNFEEKKIKKFNFSFAERSEVYTKASLSKPC